MLKLVEVVNQIHKYGVIHCDLKPNNILIDINNNVKLVDFDIATNDYTNHFYGYGSIKYCSKMQLLDSKIDYTADLYSLGIIFYELIFQINPFGEKNADIISNKKNSIYNKVDNEFLDIMFSKLFQITEEKQYNSVREFEIDLKKFYMEMKEEKRMNNANEKYLPIGTVVMLKGGTKRVMITGFCSMANDNKSVMYDYSGCLYPEGFLSSNETALFNHNQIAQIYHMGLVDDEEKKFKETLNGLVAKMLSEGQVTTSQSQPVQNQMPNNNQ